MKRQKDFLILAILTLLTVIAWIVFDVYHSYVVSTITPAMERKIKPFDPEIDVQVIQSLKEKIE